MDVTNLLFSLLNDDEVFEELEVEICEDVQEGGFYDPDDFKE